MVATIEYIEKVIETYDKAVVANANAERREGNIIELKARTADEVMVTADLHGDRKNFNAIRHLANLAKHPGRHLVMQEVCHGGPTYPGSGGCMSHTMLEDVARLKTEFPEQVHFLMSNHEMAELMDYPIVKNQKMLNLLFRIGLQDQYGPAIEKVRDAYMPFIRTLPLAVRVEGGVWISHTLPENVDNVGMDLRLFDREITKQDLVEHSPLFNFVWGRDFRQENADAFAKKVDANVLIHGHEPCPEGYHLPNTRQIILDSNGEKGSYVLLKVGEKVSQEQVVKRIKRLRKR
ncbi:MAG: metallophosphoesterase [Planctomycetota bacterium]|nr:metallophosphoesterase [Planctomycetota bacterium]